jgi:hypothetical protein
MAQNKLGLEGEDFWTQPFKSRDVIESKLLEIRNEELIVGMPDIVPLDIRETLPLIVLRVGFQNNMARRGFRKTALVTASEVNTKQIYAGMALRQDIDEPPALGEVPNEWMGGEAFNIDLREVLDLPWNQGEYIVTLIMWDQVSDRLTTKLMYSPGYKLPRLAESIEPPRMLPEMAVWPEPGKPLPSYVRQDDSPSLPEENENHIGIALSVARVTVIKKNTQGILYGSFRLPIKDHEILNQGKQNNPGQPDPTAIVPMNLLLTGSLYPWPVVLRLKVPSYTPIEITHGGACATGYFTFNLCALAGLDRAPQTYFIYAFSGKAMTGPVPMAFIAQNSLER